MTRNDVKSTSREGERGAVTIKAVLIVVCLVIAAVVLIKVVPVYIEQQQIYHDTDELARKAALGTAAYSKDKIEREIVSITQNYGLPEGSIQLATLEGNHSEISVKYTREIDFFIASYSWGVEYRAVGKGI